MSISMEDWDIACYFEKYVDHIHLNYTVFVSWFLWFILIMLLSPLIIVSLLYISIAICYIYKTYRSKIRGDFDKNNYEVAQKTISVLWSTFGYIWHGYEVIGMENIPDNKPALLIYYHGALPSDLYLLMAAVHLQKKRVIINVADRFLFKIPGMTLLAEAYKFIPGSLESCSKTLNDNNLLAISPGGVYEAQFSDSRYHLLWKNRKGFARVALHAKVPIIPIFTQNLRESYRTVGLFRKIWIKLYELTKMPIVPIYGGFPVKLRTYIGSPILHEDSTSPDELALKVRSALEDLITKHQLIPGSIPHAFMERLSEPSSSKKKK